MKCWISFTENNYFDKYWAYSFFKKTKIKEVEVSKVNNLIYFYATPNGKIWLKKKYINIFLNYWSRTNWLNNLCYDVLLYFNEWWNHHNGIIVWNDDFFIYTNFKSFSENTMWYNYKEYIMEYSYEFFVPSELFFL